MEVTETNLQFLAQLREAIPKTAVGISGLLEAYRQADSLLKKAKGTIKGSEAVKMLLQFGVTAHQSTISRWFKKAAGGYKRDQEYKPEQLRTVLISAFLYKASNTHKLPEELNHG